MCTSIQAETLNIVPSDVPVQQNWNLQFRGQRNGNSANQRKIICKRWCINRGGQVNKVKTAERERGRERDANPMATATRKQVENRGQCPLLL